jgi:uncharacterized membrane protein
MDRMNKLEKILIGVEVILALVLFSADFRSSGDIFSSLLLVLIGSAFIPFIISIIFARENKEKGISRRLAQWKIFVKVYLPFLIIIIIGNLAS